METFKNTDLRFYKATKRSYDAGVKVGMIVGSIVTTVSIIIIATIYFLITT